MTAHPGMTPFRALVFIWLGASLTFLLIFIVWGKTMVQGTPLEQAAKEVINDYKQERRCKD